MDSEPTTPYHEILDQIKETVEDFEFLTVLNSHGPLGNDDVRAENCTRGFIQIYNNSCPEKNLSSNGYQENDGSNENDSQTLTSLTHITT